MKMLKSNLMAVLTVLLLPLYAAAVPNYINYQGRLVDNNGNPMSGSKSVTFRICDTLAGACSATCSVGNTCLWDEPQTVTLENGIFSVRLGAVDPLTSAVYAADDRFLEVIVDAVTLSPRVQLVSVPFALSAGGITSATGVSISTYITVAGHVTASKFYGDGSSLTGLGAGAIADGSITTAKLADNAITTIKLTDANVTTAKIADSNVTDAKIVSVSASKVNAGALGSQVIASSVAVGAVQDASIVGVSASKISGSLPAAQVAAGSLGSQVIASSVAVGAVQDASIVGVSGSKVSGNISGNAAGLSGTLPAAQVAAGTLPSNVIVSSIAYNAMYAQSICTAGQVLKAAAGAWACGTDETGAGGTVTGSGAADKIAFWTAGSTLGSYTNLTWDSTNFRLGIGNATPSQALHVTGNIAVTGTVDTRDVSVDGAALDSHVANVSNPHSVTATHVGLGNVNNTSDVNKPVSTAQQTALDGKAGLAGVNTWTSSQTVTAALGVKVNYGVTMATAVISDTGASALDVAGGINAGSGNVGIVDATGKIPALSATYLADLSGANLTSLNAGSLGSGTVPLARLSGITNTEIGAGAGIIYSKLSIADGDLTIAKTSGLQTALDGKAGLAGVNTWTSSQTVTAAGGLAVTYGIVAGTITLSNGIHASSATLTGDAEVRGLIKAGSTPAAITDASGSVLASKLTGVIPLTVTVFTSAACEGLSPSAVGQFCYDTALFKLNVSTAVTPGGYEPLH